MWNRLAVIVCAFVVLFGAGQLVAAEAPADGGKPAKRAKEKAPKAEKQKVDRSRAIYDQMAEDLGFTAQQKAELDRLVTARSEALKNWDTQNAEAVKQQKEAIKAAGKENKEAAAAAKKALSDLMAERKKIEEEYRAKIMGLLTPQQQAAWDGVVLYRSTMNRYRKVKPELDESQKAKIKELCLATAKEISNLKAEDKKAKGEALKKLDASIRESVLTAEQADSMGKKPEKAEKAPKAPKEKKQKKQKPADDEDDDNGFDDEM